MSTSTSNTSLARTRSLRIPASGNLKSAAPANSSTQAPSGTSYVSLFLTNLRLLDLDLRSDWPDITALTFSTKDAQQNQKKRIQSVEWALFQLFALWDPEETRNKLQPFFPPLEQLQSLNLRAALFRCLDHAKKVGVLGRDTVLRKTMLDECKGERLEEVLAVFSNVVLKTVMQEAPNTDGSIAKELALENFSYTGERTVLSTLILAHKASLSKHLRVKNDARARVHDFEDLLNLNERRIARRHEQLKEMIGERDLKEQLSRREVEAVQRTVQSNWSGNDRWLDEILYGARSNEDGVLSTRFDKVWKHVDAGSISELEGKVHTGLMEQLDARVRDQENRLAKWQAFGRKLEKSGQGSPSKKATPISSNPQRIDLGLNQHQQLQVSRSGSSKAVQISAPKLEEYSRLIENMKAELAEVGKPQKPSKRPRQSLASERRQSTLPIVEKEATPPAVEDDGWSSDNSPEETSPGLASYSTKSISQTPPSEVPAFDGFVSEEEPTFELKKSGENAKIALQNELPIRSLRSTPRQRSVSPPIISRSTSKILTYDDPVPSKEPEIQFKKPELPTRLVQSRKAPNKQTILKEGSVSPLPIPQTHEEQEPAKLTPPIDHEAELADQILNSMAAASPSPKKRHTLSLAERTRLSMSRNNHTQFSDLHDEFEIADLPRLAVKSRQSTVLKTPTEEEPQLHAGLIERTRKSMAGFEAAQKKAQIERRKSVKDEKKKQRQSSYFPKVEEEAVSPDVIAVDMMQGDPDYDSVFKSRPKIATSPAVSPSRIWEDEGED